VREAYARGKGEASGDEFRPDGRSPSAVLGVNRGEEGEEAEVSQNLELLADFVADVAVIQMKFCQRNGGEKVRPQSLDRRLRHPALVC
jgi:hypothetical protein